MKLCRVLPLAVALTLTSACFFSEPRVFSDNPRVVPDVSGETVGSATETLESDGFLVKVTTADGQVDPKTCPEAPVTGQDPEAGEVGVRGLIITLEVQSCP